MVASVERPTKSAFDQIGQQAYTHHRAPGFAFLVWSRGRIVFAKGYGFSNLATRSPVTANTRFAIGSLTKQFTAVSILLLAQQGKISLEDRLKKYVPSMPDADRITLRMLLNQDSGLHNYPNTREHPWPLTGRIAPETIINFLRTDKPDFAPGAKWAYSNTNYAMLAAVVACASGTTYSSFLTHHIFGPLGMSSSGNGFAAQSGTATPYESSNGNFRPVKRTVSLDLYYGAGSIVSSARDLARWDSALLGDKILDSGSRRELWTNGRLPDGKPVEYAMGFVATSVGTHREVWHNGYAPFAGGYCFNAIFPDDSLAVVVLSNAPDQSFRGEPETMVKQVLALYD